MKGVGFIGLGNMGGALASRLIGKVPLTVYDLNSELAMSWDKPEITVAKDLRELSRKCEIVLLCLPTSQDVSGVLIESNGISSSLRAGSLIIDMTTGDPGVTRNLSKCVSSFDISFIDAPVSGGPRGAREGSIAILVGGSKVEFKRAEKILRFISSNVIHAGSVGAGHSAKLGNNLLNLICRMGTYEVVSMLVKEGIKPSDAVSIIQKSSGRNYATEITLPDNILSGKMHQGFSTSLMEKDSSLALQMGASNDMEMALGTVANLLLERTIARYGRDADMSSVANLFEVETGARIRP